MRPTAPTSAELSQTNAQWQTALSLRVGIESNMVARTQCQLARLDGEQCNAALDTGHKHAMLCDVGPVKMRTHNALVAVLAKAVLRTSGWADIERVVPS